MYVIIPCITGASKPNERLYQNDRLHHKPVLFAEETSLTVSHLNHTDFSNKTSAFNQINKWFAANLLSLNLEKT
jgi:hypothetical protein